MLQPVVSPVASAVAGSVANAMTGGGNAGDVLTWNGVDAYGTMIPWSMSGYGDSISGSITPASIDADDDYLFDSTDGKCYLKITATTGVLTTGYLDVDGSTQRVITGPALVADTQSVFTVNYNADGVVLTVDGTDYSSANVPYGLKDDLTNVAATVTPSQYFNGVIHYLKFTNITPMQNTDAVQGNNSVYGSIPQQCIYRGNSPSLDLLSGYRLHHGVLWP